MEQISPKTGIFSNPQTLNSSSYKIIREVFNAVTHGIGFILALVGTVFLFYKGYSNQNLTEIIAYMIYGISMMILFFNSTLYHSFYFTQVREVFKFLDHASIYLLIAGTYTPFALLVIGGRLGWLIVILEWGIAFIGIVAKAIQAKWIQKYSLLVYLLMGWLCLIAIRPFIQNYNLPGTLWLVAGGLLYSLGTIFYANDHKYAFFHVIWHLFVIAAAACMFISIYFYI